MAGNVIGSVMLRPCPTQLFQLHTLGEGEELGQDLWERPFPPDPSVWDTSLLLQPICAISSQALVRLAKSGACSTVDIHGYWCNFCQYTSDDKADFAKHVITHRFSCQFCLFSSFTRSNVILHIIASHAEKEASADLKYCVLRMDVEGEGSAEEREPLPLSVRRQFVQSLSLSGEVFKKRKLFSQGEGRLSKVAKRFPSDSPSPLSLGSHGLPDSSGAPRLEIDNAEDALVPRAAEERTQARRCSPSGIGSYPAVRGTPTSKSPRPGSNCSTTESSSPHIMRSSQGRPCSQPYGEGSRGFQTLRRLLIQPEEVRHQQTMEWDTEAPNSAAGSRGMSSAEDEGLPPPLDDEEGMSDCTQESSENSLASDEFQFHGSLKSISAKAHHTRYRQRCTTASTSSSSSDHPVQRGRSTSLLQSTLHAAAGQTFRVRSNSLGEENNGIDWTRQRSDKFPLLYQYLTQENIVDEYFKERVRTVQPSKKHHDRREIQMEAPILWQCLSQTSQQDGGKHSSPCPQVSSMALPHGVSIKQEPQSEDFISDAATASPPKSSVASGVVFAFASSRGRPGGEMMGNGTHSSTQEWETGRPIATSGSVEQRENFSKAQTSHPAVKQEPLDDSYQFSTFIPTHQSKTSLTTSVMPSCASRGREHSSSPQLPRDLSPCRSSQQPLALAETPPPRSTELRRLLAEQRVPAPQNPWTTFENTSANPAKGESLAEGRGDVAQEKSAAGHQFSASEHLPSTRGSSLLRNALLQAGSEVPPASKKTSSGGSSAEVDMLFSRLLQSLVPVCQGQNPAEPSTKTSILPTLLMSSQPYSPSPTTSAAPFSPQCSGQPMDLSKRGPKGTLHSLETSAEKFKSPKTEPSEEAAATSVLKDDSSSDGMRFLIEDIKSLNESASCESDAGDPCCEKKESKTVHNGDMEDPKGSAQNSAVDSPSDGELGYRNKPDNCTNDYVPHILNLTTSERTSNSSSDLNEKFEDGSPAGNDPEGTQQDKAHDAATHLSISPAPSSSSSSSLASFSAPGASSTSTSGRPTSSGVGPCPEAALSPSRSCRDGKEPSDSHPIPGSSKSAPRMDVRQSGMNVDYHTLLQMKIGMGHYFTDSVDSSDQEEVTDEEGKEDYCSGHSSLWTDADKDVRKLTVETEEPSPEEIGEVKRV